MSANFEFSSHARRGGQGIDFKEIVAFGAFFTCLVWPYPGMGDTWFGLLAILPVLVAMMVFSCPFWLAHVQSDRPRYQLFAHADLASWTFFSTSLTLSGNTIPYYPESHATPGGSGGVIGRDSLGDQPARPGLLRGGWKFLSDAGYPGIPVGARRFSFGPNPTQALGIQHDRNR